MIIERRAWQWVDWALFGILTSGLAIGLLFLISSPGLGSLNFRLMIALWGLIGYITIFIFWRPGYTHLWGLPFSVLLTIGILELYISWKVDESINVVTVPLIVLGFHSKGKQLLFNIAVYIFALPILGDFLTNSGPLNFPIVINKALNSAMLLGIGFGIQRLWVSHYGVRQLYEENMKVYRLVQEQNKALEQYANQIEKLTLVEERNRLARELHDTVGHTFTSVIMGMDAVSYLMEVAPDKAREKLDVLRQVTRNGLEEVRRSIHQIAPPVEEGSFTAQLSRVAHEFSIHTGTQIQVQPSGEEYELSRHLQLTLIRCLQEALTNAKRHGQAALVQVRLEYEEQRFVLSISDNGIGAEEIESGFGLTSMKERLASIQGTLQITAAKGHGTTVICSVPIRGPQV